MIQSIDEATDGTQALELVGAHQYDVAFIDVCMPGANGLSVAARLLNQDRQAEVIIISAYDRFEYAHEAIALRVLGYILKPFDDAVVLDQFDRALGELTRKRLVPVGDTVRISKEFIEKELMRMFYLGNGRMIDLLAETLEVPRLHGIFVYVVADPPLRKSDVKWALVEAVPRTRFICDLECTFLMFGRRPVNDQLANQIAYHIRCRTNRDVQVFVSDYADGAARMCAQLQTLLSRVHSKAERHFVTLSPSSDRGTLLHQPFDVEGEITQALSAGRVEDVETVVTRELQRMSARLDLGELCDQAVQLVHVLRAAIAKVGLVTRPAPSSVILDCISKVQNKEEVLSCTRTVIRTEMGGFVLAGDEHTDGRYRHLLNFVNSHIFDFDLSLTVVADAMGWTTQSVCRAFKRSIGRTFLSYISEKRLEVATSLFLSTDRSVMEVAKAVGFRDVNYFSRLFKKRMGVQPGLYRRHCERLLRE